MPTLYLFIFCIYLTINSDFSQLLHKVVNFCIIRFNPLEPSGQYMYQQFNKQGITLCPHCINLFCISLRTNSDLRQLLSNRNGFYNIDLTLFNPIVTICTAGLIFKSVRSAHTQYAIFIYLRPRSFLCHIQRKPNGFVAWISPFTSQWPLYVPPV